MTRFILRVVMTTVALALGVLVFPSQAVAQCDPGCAPVTWGSPSHMKYVITYKSGVTATDQQKKEVSDFVSLAASFWNDEFDHRDRSGSVTAREGGAQSGDITIVVTDAISGDQATYDYRDTRVLQISKDYLTQFDWAYKIAAIVHEFGHAMGFLGSDCPNASVMSPQFHNNYRTAFTDCDKATFTHLFGPRTDEEPPPPDDGGGDGQNETPDCGADCGITPIVVPLARSRAVQFTCSTEGVTFDLDADGFAERTAWTDPAARLAFLAIDWNGNGLIDDGSELFGSRTVPGVNNGFTALQRLNMELNGGIPVDRIDEGQPLYQRLLLWEDANHNGVSEPNELQPASNLFSSFGVSYELHARRDGHGNLFRFRGTATIHAVQGQNPRTSSSEVRERTIFVYDVIFAR